MSGEPRGLWTRFFMHFPFANPNMRLHLQRLSTGFLLATLACVQNAPTPSAAEFRRMVGGSDWELVELAGREAPTGNGGRRATLRFEADTARAGGFAGCNRYGGTYTVDGANIKFGPLMMTKMGCADGMELEQNLARALERADRFDATATELKFLTGADVVARFERAAP